MGTATAEARETGSAILDIGEDVGALIVYTRKELLGREIEVSPKGNAARRTHTEVRERRFNGQTLWAGVFPELAAGEYSLWREILIDEPIAIIGGSVAEVQWLDITDPSDFRLAQPEGRSRSAAYAAPLTILPPQYRTGKVVNNVPMGSAPMQYTPDGGVAWDQMWTNFCDLAMAGGPPHRDSLLEPATAEEVQASPTAYEQVVTQIERGFRMVAELPTVCSETPGWVGLQCDDEYMARWMVRAISLENVSVRRDGAALFLPAGPSFRLDKEIKNVVTVAAKIYHYWQEHRDYLEAS